MIEIAKGATETEIVAVVKNVVREALHRRQPYMDRLQRNWDLYIGNHWLFDPPKGHEKVTLNYVGTLLDSLVSFFTGSNPEFEPEVVVASAGHGARPRCGGEGLLHLRDEPVRP